MAVRIYLQYLYVLCSAVVRDAGDELVSYAEDLVDKVVDAIHSVSCGVLDN